MIDSIKFIPTLTPTFEQWKLLPVYLAHHETSLQRRFGAVKIIPPSRWSPLTKNPYELRQIKFSIKQEIIRSSHQSDVFYIQNYETSKRRLMTYEECKITAESDSYRVKDEISNNFTEYFWLTIPNNISLYVPNIDDSLFAKRENVFNMTQLPSLLKYYPKPIPGVTTPFLHIGMWSTSVGLHIDEHDLISLNYLHHGAPKIWYIIHPSSYAKLEELVNELKLFSDISSCLSPLQHKSLLIKPSFLQLHSIEYYYIEQKINELVVIFPGTYHFYFDTGFNLSETVKYALPSWLEFQRRSPRLCSCSISSSINTNLNRRFFTNDILQNFQDEYLTSSSTTCIDLSLDEDNNHTNDHLSIELAVSPTSSTRDHSNINETTEETVVLSLNTPMDISLNKHTTSLSSSSSLINCDTSTSNDLISTMNSINEHEDIWNIFDQLSAPINSNTLQHYHPYKSFSSPIQNHTPPMYPPFLRSCPYSHPRLYPSRRDIQRRKCYKCRRPGHIRKECPYYPQE
ncbi:unnamed protein product [Adineta steineri]|uniref:Uncharacterized protein n=1 Tax=Adineta steineri TaxID=433720 RepID=A0A814S1Y2_9BILA|nr:unnamed protein product [Adineta steineri]CAF3574760.1 unnamed protein product [Adineta steineri]